jgi:hypothetical protein
MQDVRKRGPEAVTWDTLKGKRVLVYLLGDPAGGITGTLVWVDRFSIGVESKRFEDRFNKAPSMIIVHKGPGLCVKLCEEQPT